MKYRRKLLAVFAVTVFVSVTAVAWITSVLTRHTFEQADELRTATLVTEFRHEFDLRGEEVGRLVEAIAKGDASTRMAVALNHGAPDYGTYLNEAKTIAENQRLDFLEFLDSEGKVVSSAQSPAKFGYKEALPSLASTNNDIFLRQEDLPDGAALSLSAIRVVTLGDAPLYVVGGQRLDKDFLASLGLSSGTRAMLYQNAGETFSPQLLIDSSGMVQNSEPLLPLINQVRQNGREAKAVVHWSSHSAEDEAVYAIPLTGQRDQLLGILLVGNSRGTYVLLQQHIRSAALLAGGAGMVLAILFSGWAAARVTRPVERLADAAREVTAGNWTAQVPVNSSDELGELAGAFNHMTHELLEQRESLVQSERVAAWRELARRLAHELKNPLFPLQLTVENLLRAHEQSAQVFEEIFQESSSTLLAEIANLKNIITRFGEFSRMPQPQWQPVDLNDILRNLDRLFHAQLNMPDHKPIECKLELTDPMMPIAADPDLLHRALSNLVLNAMDAMPEGGTLRLGTRQAGERASIEVSDTGLGLTQEECERLFTPYYTSKTQGTGLGLAIVQSIISDHGGKISVRSMPSLGTTFVIELPPNMDKL
ncbi:MAG: periplasmic sensor signal transduction histidine kinase [Acidobacteriaceae bacterium]|nr:periplasmic sensor signal transduction histidine kinase [Acidobacteriaceae bacterium]